MPGALGALSGTQQPDDRSAAHPELLGDSPLADPVLAKLFHLWDQFGCGVSLSFAVGEVRRGQVLQNQWRALKGLHHRGREGWSETLGGNQAAWSLAMRS